MKISIFASIGCQNLGDELILKNEIKLLENGALEKIIGKKISKCKYIVFTYDKKNIFFSQKNISYELYFPIGIRQIKNIFKNIVGFLNLIFSVILSKYIIIGGGGLIYDSEIQANSDPLDQMIFRSKIFRFFRKKVIFYAVGINIKNPQNYEKLKLIFKNSYKIFVRDSYSQNILEKIGITSEIIPDPVWFDNDARVSNFDTFPQLNNNYLIRDFRAYEFKLDFLKGLNFDGKLVGITFRKGQFSIIGNEESEIKVVTEIVNYLLKSGAKVVFLPHSFHKTDYKSNDYLYYKEILENSGLGGKVKIAENLDEVYNYYKEEKLDVCFAMRFHSIILSQVYGIPFLAFSYSKKTEELINILKQKIKG